MAHPVTFAIQASPAAIWRVLLAEIDIGVAAGRARLRDLEAPRVLSVDVALGWGLRVRYHYTLTDRGRHTEVEASAAPSGIRYRVAAVLTLGRAARAYRLALAQGLANLKAALENPAESPAESLRESTDAPPSAFPA